MFGIEISSKGGHNAPAAGVPDASRGSSTGTQAPRKRGRVPLGISFFVMLFLAAGLAFYIYFHVSHNIRVVKLFTAVEAGNVRELETLLGKGARPDETDVRWSQQTVLMRAAQLGQTEVLKVLLAHGAKVDARSDDPDSANGRTALMYAAENPSKFGLEALLEKGANINARDAQGQSALILALDRQLQSNALYLLARGADPNAKNIFGVPALIVALDKVQFDAARLLIMKGADINAVDPGRSSVNVQFKTKGFSTRSISYPQRNPTPGIPGRTPLMAAVQAGNRQIVQLLLDRGARVDARAKNGTLTVLKLASTNNYAEMVLLLKAAGATE